MARDPVQPGRRDGLITTAARSHPPGTRGDRPLSTPIDRATTWEAGTADEHRRRFHDGEPTVYYRFGNPTTEAAATKVAELEGAEAGLVFSSGMGAIATSLLAVLKSGDHVVAQDAIFDQTRRFLAGPLAALGVHTTFLDPRTPGAVAAALRAETRLVYVETPSNPLLHVIPLAPLGALARERGVLLFVDSTFASPALQQPLAHGASLVLHSGTKYLGGHSDVMCGVAAGGADLIGRIRAMQILVGTVLAPDAAWLLLRGIKTLGVRVPRQAASALALARFLASHAAVAEVRYPFLGDTAEATVARAQMRAGGGVVSFRMREGREAAARLLDRLRGIVIATSLGGVESVAELPFDLDFESSTGAAGAWIRLSVGIEDLDDLLDDLRQALG